MFLFSEPLSVIALNLRWNHGTTYFILRKDIHEAYINVKNDIQKNIFKPLPSTKKKEMFIPTLPSSGSILLSTSINAWASNVTHPSIHPSMDSWATNSPLQSLHNLSKALQGKGLV